MIPFLSSSDVTSLDFVSQVKTWFANARRRIHKGESFQSTKRTGNGLDVKDNNFAKNQFMILSDFDESYPVEVNLPTDSVSKFNHIINAKKFNNCRRFIPTSEVIFK